MNKAYIQFLLATLLLGVCTGAFAHPGHGISGWSAGFSHPFSGLDHLLAMVAVGLWATNGRQKIWLPPAVFMIMLGAGAVISQYNASFPLVEMGVASSVLILGLLAAVPLQIPVVMGVLITALFGLVHGYAHGLELPVSAAPVAYALGFLTATGMLHSAGIAIGLVSHTRFLILRRFLGFSIAASGAFLLISI